MANIIFAQRWAFVLSIHEFSGLGLGRIDSDYIRLFTGGDAVPVVVLAYVTATLSGSHYFDHEFLMYVVPPSGHPERLDRREGPLVEEIIWNNLRSTTSLSPPRLDPALVSNAVKQDARIREELGAEARDEDGRWVGAVWPIAATVLLPTRPASPQGGTRGT